MQHREHGSIKELTAKAGKFLPGASLGNMYGGMVIRQGKGGRVWDVAGREYVDFVLGSGPMLLGHGHPEVIDAVRAQIARGTTFFADNEHAIELAEQVVAAVGCAEKLRYCCTGTEATHYALRAARAFMQRDLILKFEGGYHGMNDYALMSMAPTDPPPYPQAQPDSAGIPKVIEQRTLIAPFNDAAAATAVIEQYGDELAAVIVEPIQRLIPPRPGFLQALRDVTKRLGIVLIFDEVVTGFRFAYGGGQVYYGVTPDLCALAKVLGGGFPLAAVTGRADIMAHFDPAIGAGRFMPQVGTLSGNPVAAGAGLATLKVLRREGTYERLFATGRLLMSRLQSALDEAGVAAKVLGEPPMFDVFFTHRPVTDYRSSLAADKAKLVQFNKLLLEQGVFKGDSKFYVSLAHSEADIEQTLAAFGKVAAGLAGLGAEGSG